MRHDVGTRCSPSSPRIQCCWCNGSDAGHDGADALLVAEFLRFVRHGGLTATSPVAAREAVAAGILATASLRGDGSAISVPPLDPDLVAYFERGQTPSSTPSSSAA